jgi:secretion/DNA translocation related TadE-like protein
VTGGRGARGSGSVLGVAVLAGVIIIGSSSTAVVSGLAEARRVQGVANQAALAASDVSRGIVSGFPCDVARAIVAGAGYRMVTCDVGDGEARVSVGSSWWTVPIDKRARAGPIPSPVFGLGDSVQTSHT